MMSGMVEDKGPCISTVVHQAFVEVYQEGTEAAAVTGVLMLTSAGPPLLRFRTDHPFLFFIRDKATGGVLFIGRMLNPQE